MASIHCYTVISTDSINNLYKNRIIKMARIYIYNGSFYE